MPRPMPANTRPLARPRWRGGMCASTVGAASTMSAPPEMPETMRQPKNHAKSSGQAQAASEATVASIIARSTPRTGQRADIGPPSSAPAR